MIARISASACALARTRGSTDSAAVDAIEFAVGAGRLGLVRRGGASAGGRAVHASVSSVAVLTCAVSSGTDYVAAVDAIKFAVGTGLFSNSVRGYSARLCRLAVITAIARVTSSARARFSDAADTATVDAIELAVGAGRHVLV